MTPWMTTVVVAAFVGLVTLSVFMFARQRRTGPFVFSIATLAGVAWLLHRLFGFPTPRLILASKSLAPVLASPIIFIPLLASQQNADLDLSRFDIPRFMIFLVAFENGFFWREYFDNRKKKAVP